MKTTAQRSRFYCITLAVCMLLLGVTEARGASITIFLDPLQDAWLSGDPVNLVADLIDRGDSNITARNIPGDVRRLLFEFPLASLSGFNIDSAIFSFSTSGGTVDLITYTANGVTELADWFPPGQSFLTSFTAPLPSTKTIETIDVTAALISQLNAAGTFFGIQIRGAAGDEAQFLMSEALGSPDLFNGGPVDSTMVPQLQIEATAAVPEPATLLLLASGLAGLSVARRRKRRR